MLLTIFVLFVVAVLCLAAWEYKQRHPSTDTPLPPLIGFSELASKPEEPQDVTFNRIKAKHGQIVRIRIPFYTNLIIAVGGSASKIYHMLKEDDAGFYYGFRIFSFLGFGPSHHKANIREPNLTALLEKAFNRERHNHFAKVTRAGHLNYMARFWNQDVQQVDLFKEMYELNIRLVVRSFMGEMQEQQLEQIITTIKHLDLEERIKSVSNIVHNFSWNGRKDLEKHWFATLDLVKELVQIRKNTPSELSDVEFFDFLVAETTDDKGNVDYELLTSRVFGTIFVAVLNTFATSAWFLFRVFDNPEIYAKVKKEQEEYYSLLKDPQAELGTILINKFQYSDYCIREVIRTSVSGISFRRAKHDFVMRDSDNKKDYFVPRDTYLMMPYNTIVRDPSIWSDPDVFRPERFETEAKGPCENVTFGAGRHPCTGTKFAMLNVKNIAFNLMAHYDVTVPGKAEDYMPKLQPMGVFRPIKPVIFTLRKRTTIES